LAHGFHHFSIKMMAGTCPLAGLGVTWRSMDQAGVASGIHFGGVVRHKTRVVVMVDRQQRAL